LSIDETRKVDIISIDSNGRVILTISDHLAWDDEHHLELLQAKLNTYLAFVESGEVYDSYPDSKGRTFAFKVSCKFQPSKRGLAFLERARKVIEEAGFDFQHEVFAASYDN
jgi:hypothetical protein